nr:hypothetical protein Iba_chr14eCG7080 [Ipomoea batatas]
MFSNVFFIIPPPVRVLSISAITSANSTTVSAIFLKTEVTFLKDSSDNSSRTFSAIYSVHAVIAGGLGKIRVPESVLLTSELAALRLATALLPFCAIGCAGIAVWVSKTSLVFLCLVAAFFISALQQGHKS